LDALARICALATRALPVKAEVERAAILSERRVVVCCKGCRNGRSRTPSSFTTRFASARLRCFSLAFLLADGDLTAGQAGDFLAHRLVRV
jgi:hypothetical protein